MAAVSTWELTKFVLRKILPMSVRLVLSNWLRRNGNGNGEEEDYKLSSLLYDLVVAVVFSLSATSVAVIVACLLVLCIIFVKRKQIFCIVRRACWNFFRMASDGGCFVEKDMGKANVMEDRPKIDAMTSDRIDVPQCRGSMRHDGDAQDDQHEYSFDYADRQEHAKILNAQKAESGVDRAIIPKHVAVIMDGNRRYGKRVYGSATQGHWQGSRKVVDFAKWCIVEGIEVLTVYAFSTENWSRDSSEISALMSIFIQYCDDIRTEALQNGIQVKILSTDETQLPQNVKRRFDLLVEETSHCSNFVMNICLSYGGRGEIVEACKSIVRRIQNGSLQLDDVDESEIGNSLLTKHCKDPDLVIRTSGEMRLSNFLLWQLAYSEMFFLEKQWPEIEKEDLLEIIRCYACKRERRFGR